LSWQSAPRGFKIEPLPVGSTQVHHVNGRNFPVETIAVNDTNERALVEEIERLGRQHYAETIYLSEPLYRELPCVFGTIPQPPRRQWYCYACFVSAQKAPVRRSGVKLDAPAIGFRAFNWNGGALLGVGFSAPWPITKEPQVANCAYEEGSPSSGSMATMWPSSGRNHAADGDCAPVESCSCGIYSHALPEQIPQGVIKAVTIGYGKIIVHPDGWRAEKSELIALIAPPKPPSECEHKWEVRSATLCCSKCHITRQEFEQHKLEAEASGQFFQPGASPTMVFSGLLRSAWFECPMPPSLAALEILAEQYGARVVDSWDDAVALAEEQGAKPIPDELYAEAAENASSGYGPTGGGEFIAPMWTSNIMTTNEARESFSLPNFTSNRITIPAAVRTTLELSFYGLPGGWAPGKIVEYNGTNYVVLSVERKMNGETRLKLEEAPRSASLWKPPSISPSSPKKRKKSAIDNALKLKREKRELHAKHWKPGAKAA